MLFWYELAFSSTSYQKEKKMFWQNGRWLHKLLTFMPVLIYLLRNSHSSLTKWLKKASNRLTYQLIKSMCKENPQLLSPLFLYTCGQTYHEMNKVYSEDTIIENKCREIPLSTAVTNMTLHRTTSFFITVLSGWRW